MVNVLLSLHMRRRHREFHLWRVSFPYGHPAHHYRPGDFSCGWSQNSILNIFCSAVSCIIIDGNGCGRARANRSCEEEVLRNEQLQSIAPKPSNRNTCGLRSCAYSQITTPSLCGTFAINTSSLRITFLSFVGLHVSAPAAHGNLVCLLAPVRLWSLSK